MNIRFKSVKLHNFMSFSDAQINLENRGYCVVNGINMCTKDGADSNGSGKSSIWSSICWCLTGETLQGIKTSVSNIQLDGGCFVELEFNIDNDSYKVIRYREYEKIGNDLKIFINGEDKSGKTYTQSQQLLEQYIPDITPKYIGNVIILGQGMPYKFTSYTPSGRKELLEKLSKSDFMIEDMKNRIETRSTTLKTMLRDIEDNITRLTASMDIYTKQQEEDKAKLDKLREYDEKEVDDNIETLTKECECIENNLTLLKESIEKKTKEKIELDINIKEIYLNKDRELLEANNKYNNSNLEISSKIRGLDNEINLLNKQIEKFKSLGNICPTCGTPISEDKKCENKDNENQLESLVEERKSFNVKLGELQEAHNSEMSSIVAKYEDSSNISLKINELVDSITKDESLVVELNNDLSSKRLKLNECIQSKLLHAQQVKELEDRLSSHFNNLTKLYEEKLYNNIRQNDLQKHIDVIDKMNTLVKRDFRGYLLSNVIDFINSKAKVYCNDIFNTDELEIKLSGNNIDITYCNKAYELLSGGEKQKIDVIIQFAIRDMMVRYLNFSSNILVLDEVFDYLDKKGTNNLLNFISNNLTDVESVFIISHRISSLGISYDDEILVKKDEQGVSRI